MCLDHRGDIRAPINHNVVLCTWPEISENNNNEPNNVIVILSVNVDKCHIEMSALDDYTEMSGATDTAYLFPQELYKCIKIPSSLPTSCSFLNQE